jgi:uncharacterized protein
MAWAIVAGGSKGIGLAIAEALAKRSFDLLIVARSPDALQNAKVFLEKKYIVRVEVFCGDLSLSETSNMLLQWFTNRNLTVKVLCNAAGLGGAADFPDLPLDKIRTMTRLNMESAIALSYLFIPLLKQAAPSYILNVSSMAGFSPIPMKAVYASTKAGLISFSYSLKCLLEKDRISVCCLCPGPVFTKPEIEQETGRQLGWIGKQMSIEPSKVGERAVHAMFKHKLIVVPGKLSAIFSCFLRSVPHQFMSRIFYAFGKRSRK